MHLRKYHLRQLVPILRREGDKLCAKKERSLKFRYFAISNQVLQLSKGFQKNRSRRAKLHNKVSKFFIVRLVDARRFEGYLNKVSQKFRCHLTN